MCIVRQAELRPPTEHQVKQNHPKRIHVCCCRLRNNLLSASETKTLACFERGTTAGWVEPTSPSAQCQQTLCLPVDNHSGLQAVGF